MSSTAFMTILDNSLDALRLRLGNLKDYRRVIEVLHEKAEAQCASVAVSKVKIDIPHLSSVHQLSPETLSTTIDELHKLGVVHLWFRLRCPNDSESTTDKIVVETDNASRFRSALQESCPFCGDFHDEDIDWEHIDRIWRFNTDDTQIESFDPEHFFLAAQ